MNNEISALAYIKDLVQFSIKSREEIDAFVKSKFKHVLEDAEINCDFYKGKQPPFPLLTKEDVRNNIDIGLISNKYIGHPCLVMDQTSGSTEDAVPFAYLQGFQRYARMACSFMINGNWKWAERYCVFSTIHCSRDRCSTNNLPPYVNRVKIPTSDDVFMDQDALQRAYVILKENQGTVIHADPLYLCAVARYFDEQGALLRFKGISSSYELLTPYMKRYLEKTFQCRVFDNYGSSEFGPIAFACERDGKHIFEDSVFVEIIDKGRYLDQEVGEIVVTSLDNPAMPLIRYRTGDIGKLIVSPCGCKRNTRMIEIYGRESRCVCLKDVLHTEKDIALLMDISGVLLYQLTQNGGDLAFNILLEKELAGNDKQNSIKLEIKNRFERLEAGRISVTFVSYLKPEVSGKFNILISN